MSIGPPAKHGLSAAGEEPAAPSGSSTLSKRTVERAADLDRYQWFPRFGDIPGIDYQIPPGIDATKLPGFGMVPDRNAFDSGGERYESLWWDYGEESSSASPVHEFGEKIHGDSVDHLVTWCAKGLELPGEPGDYHFHIQSAVEELQKLRRNDHRALPEIERLCLLDLALIDAWPRAVFNAYGEDPVFYNCSAFGRLISLYENEGALHKAFAVAERAAQFSQNPDRRAEFRDRLAAILAETPG
jgi:hypothetical protein